eukprot:GHRR01007117.1.p1 GENE.GHRR01007117.1~~GHRR01007117.1.p1  ORF type:complete len:308 (+),score=139.83 GHRR01007117.1:796-1719(+)
MLQIEGVWHTGVVIDGREEIFFGYGIHRARAGTTMFGQPHRIIDLGTTELPPEMREELLADLTSRYRPEDYSLLWHNCNHFSNEFGQLLTGEGLPDYILSQAETVFNTPWGESLMPMIMAMEGFTGKATAEGLAEPSSSGAAAAALEAPVAATAGGQQYLQPVGLAAANAASAAANAGMTAAARAAQTIISAASTSDATSSSTDKASQSGQQQPSAGSGSGVAEKATKAAVQAARMVASSAAVGAVPEAVNTSSSAADQDARDVQMREAVTEVRATAAGAAQKVADGVVALSVGLTADSRAVDTAAD